MMLLITSWLLVISTLFHPSDAVVPIEGSTGADVDSNRQETHCVTGYVMDTFCIEKGTLLDNPSVKTLDEPFLHSVHCLVDVGQCIDSGFEILIESDNDNRVADARLVGTIKEDAKPTAYVRAVKLDELGNQLIRDYARSVGACRTCANLYDGEIVQGLQATVFGAFQNDNDRSIFLTSRVEPANEVDCPRTVSFDTTTSLPVVLEEEADSLPGEAINETNDTNVSLDEDNTEPETATTEDESTSGEQTSSDNLDDTLSDQASRPSLDGFSLDGLVITPPQRPPPETPIRDFDRPDQSTRYDVRQELRGRRRPNRRDGRGSS